MTHERESRRRFLKYAGATAAIVGASALGLDYLLNLGNGNYQTSTATPTPVSTVTTNSSGASSSSTTVTPILSRFRYSGVNLAWWPNNYSGQSSYDVIDHLSEIPANYIMFLLQMHQNTPLGSEISISYNPATIQSLTAYCKKKGIQVGWLPLPTFGNDGWRGEISPSNIDEWFNNYKKNLSSLAKQASATAVDLLMVGSELNKLETFSAKWHDVIANVRNEFSGNVSYGISWDNVAFLNRDWFDELDNIGVSAYFPLTSKNDPTLDELKKGWTNSPISGNIVSSLEKLYQRFGRKIFFSEVGYRAVRGTNKAPYLSVTQQIPNSDNKYDPEEQANCYEAFFEVFSDKKWWEGSFIWNYPSALGNEISIDYSPEGKLAEDVLRKWYSKIS